MVKLILMTDFTEKYANSLLKGILAYSHQTEPWVVCRMPPSFRKTNGIEGVVEWAIQWQADAIIAQFEPQDEVSLFRKKGIIAIAQDYKQRFSDIPNITGDYIAAGRKVAEFFYIKGYSDFAYYGYENVVWSDERGQGFREGLMENGVDASHIHEFRKQSLDDLWYYESQPLKEWLAALPKPVAVFACDDTRANKIIELCSTMSLRVPIDVAVIGVDNDDIICQLSCPELSSMSLDVEKAGYETAELIMRMREDKRQKPYDIIVHDTGIVERTSTDFFATRNPNVLKALSYIHMNISHPMSVSDVVEQVPVSRRLLEQEFREETSTSIYEYISRLRMNKLAQLLLTVDEPIEALAMRIGLTDSKNLSRQFKAYKGMTPLEYKKRYRI